MVGADPTTRPAITQLLDKRRELRGALTLATVLDQSVRDNA